MEKCNHKDSNTGNNLIVFDTDRWTGVHPRKIRGICIRCHKEFSIKKKKYEEFLKSGVIDE